MRIRGHVLLVALVGAGLTVRAGAAPHATRRIAPAAASCPTAARVEVAVPGEVDEVRAIIDAPTPGAATAVTVLAGQSDRELTVFGGGAWGLQLGSPLPAGRMVIAVEPVLDAPASACVDHVLLLRRGAVVARVVPR